MMQDIPKPQLHTHRPGEAARSCTERSPGRGVHAGSRGSCDNSIASRCLSDGKGKPRQLWRIQDLMTNDSLKAIYILDLINPSSLTSPWHARALWLLPASVCALRRSHPMFRTWILNVLVECSRKSTVHTTISLTSFFCLPFHSMMCP